MPALCIEEIAHTLDIRSRLEDLPQLAGRKPVVGWKDVRSGPEVMARSRAAHNPQLAGNYSAAGWKKILLITRCFRHLPVSIGS